MRLKYEQPPAAAGRARLAAAIDVVEVRLSDRASGIDGVHLDGPIAGTRVEDGPLRVVGWVVGQGTPVHAVEVLAGTAVARTGVGIPRPGVAARFPGAPGADTAGFDLSLEPSGEGASDLLVAAVLADGRRADLATIRVTVAQVAVLSPLPG